MVARRMLLNEAIYLKLLLVVVVAVGTFFATQAVVSAAADHVNTDEECDAGEPLTMWLRLGYGDAYASTNLDNGQLFGYEEQWCDEFRCYGYYYSGSPPSARTIHDGNAWSETDVYIQDYYCS